MTIGWLLIHTRLLSLKQLGFLIMIGVGCKCRANSWVINNHSSSFTIWRTTQIFLKLFSRLGRKWSRSSTLELLFISSTINWRCWKSDLRALNRSHYGDLPNCTKNAFELLCTHQNQSLLGPLAATSEVMTEASNSWHHVANIEEQFDRQKSRIQ